ncbi:MAG: hypothetical protein ACREA9_24075 [Pyrinomonadaceae bacterium]
MRRARVGVAASHSFRIGMVVLAAALFFLPSCATEKKPVAEAPPVALSTPVNQAQQVQNNLPPPDLQTVQDAVKRVFKDFAAIDANQQSVFVAGDFNGDLSQDIAVVVRPVPEKLSQMNAEFPVWILRDPFGSTESSAPRLRIAAKEVLLAVIHGYGRNGWRDPQATQTYLLKHAVGSSMKAHPAEEFATANQGRKLPRVRGEVVGETIQGRPGYLYFTGASYAWYDPTTFASEPDPRRGHGEQRMKK